MIVKLLKESEHWCKQGLYQWSQQITIWQSLSALDTCVVVGGCEGVASERWRK